MNGTSLRQGEPAATSRTYHECSRITTRGPTREGGFTLKEEPLTSSDFVGHVLEVVRAIPPGRVMTYGDVAAALGSRGARAVGMVMARYGSDVPWWRVIRAGGFAPRGLEVRARTHYVAEGTPLRGREDAYRIDLVSARHRA